MKFGFQMYGAMVEMGEIVRKLMIMLLVIFMFVTLIFADEDDYNEQTEGARPPVVQTSDG